MQQAFDYKQFIVLVVDDNEIFLDLLKVAFGDKFRILRAGSADEGLNLLKQHKDEVGALVANFCMIESPVAPKHWDAFPGGLGRKFGGIPAG